MLTKNGSWRFFISHSLSLTADTSIVHFFFIWWWFFCSWLFLLEGFLAFFWIQFRLKLFLPSFFFPRVTFIHFFHVLLLSPWCASQWLWMFFCLRKRKFSSCSFAHCTFFVVHYEYGTALRRKRQKNKKLIVNLLSLIVFLSIRN